jgi:hypothetical protein
MASSGAPLRIDTRATMDTIARIARQRVLIATIADAITAATVGKSLRVAIGWSSPEEGAFADQLTRALLARGLSCRCVQPRSGPSALDGSTAAASGTSPMVAVITSGPAGHDEPSGGQEAELCRIDIRLHTPTQSTWSGGPAPGGGPGDGPGDAPGGHGPHTSDEDHRPDIIVDYLAPNGPTICHILPQLTLPLHRP